MTNKNVEIMKTRNQARSEFKKVLEEFDNESEKTDDLLDKTIDTKNPKIYFGDHELEEMSKSENTSSATTIADLQKENSELHVKINEMQKLFMELEKKHKQNKKSGKKKKTVYATPGNESPGGLESSGSLSEYLKEKEEGDKRSSKENKKKKKSDGSDDDKNGDSRSSSDSSDSEVEDKPRKKKKVGIINRTTVSICKNTIIPFDKDNVANFIDSVKLAADQCKRDQLPFILNYSKQRVKNGGIFSEKNYVRMRDFRNNLLLQFKPTKDESTLMAEAFNLNQKFNEEVSNYAVRARVIREELCYAIKHNGLRSGQSQGYISMKISESEKTIVSRFKNGLRQGLIERVNHADTDTLPTMIEKSLAAEACFKSMMQERKVEKMKDEEKQKPEKKKFDKDSPKKFSKFGNNNENSDNDSEEKKVKCFNCQGFGHIAKSCKNPRKERDSKNEGDSQAESSEQTSSVSTLRVYQKN